MQRDVNFKLFSLIEFVGGHRCEGMRPPLSQTADLPVNLTSMKCTGLEGNTLECTEIHWIGGKYCTAVNLAGAEQVS